MGALRKIVAIIVAVLIWCGVVIGLGNFFEGMFGHLGTNSATFSFLRIIVLVVSFLLASVAYYLIKGPEPPKEESEEQGKDISSKNISKKLNQMRKDRAQKQNTDPDYLVCESCGGYYQLQTGESANDFNECECGGKLKYNKSLSVIND